MTERLCPPSGHLCFYWPVSSKWDVLSLCRAQVMGSEEKETYQRERKEKGQEAERQRDQKKLLWACVCWWQWELICSLIASWLSKVTLMYWCETSQVTSWFLSGRAGFYFTGQRWQWHDRSVSMGTHLSLLWSMAKVLEGNHQWGL